MHIDKYVKSKIVMLPKPKVLLIQEDLKNYRDPIYTIISRQVDLTVGYTVSSEIYKSQYTILKLPYFKFGPFIIHKQLRKLINQFDVVLFVPHLRLINIVLLPFIPHKPKLVTWSLGVHASYTKPYDLSVAPDFKDVIFEHIQDKADACIFYMPDPIKYWKKYRKIDEEKYFVAHNTVAVADFDDSKSIKRDIILFVGTLYQQKGIGELIDCYLKAKSAVGKLPLLVIIGKGPEKEIIENKIIQASLEKDIIMTGPIYDENILKEYFLRSIICVSPKQAGLSVLKSFGYGVPFVTRRDAITGGELYNIINGTNGLLYENEEELTEILCKTQINPEKFFKMSTAARDYYLTNASPEGMAQGVLDAIMYALNSKSI